MPLKNLNKEQHLAATTKSGHNLIIASAGTGKTSTIVGRIAHLLKTGISPNDILLLTFTNKASIEMIQRLETFFDKNITKEIEAGTFHAVAYRYLKDREKILLKKPSELKTLFRSIYNSRNFSYIDKNPPYKADYLYDLISLSINSYSGNFGDFIANRNEEHRIYCDIYNDVFLEFLELKKEYNYVSYDDLLILYRDKAKENNLKYYEVLVDEYQDTNYLQNSIIENINKQSLFCVGDYDQSIYAFNGSDINIIASFKDKYTNTNIFSLNKNYRSSKKIVEIANKVIENNPRIYPKMLEVLKDKIDSKVKVFEFDDIKEQYRYIANHIAQSRTSLKDIAIIFRNNTSSMYMEAALRELNINCKKRGGRSFFESKEIALLINILTLFFNKKDMMAFVNIISMGVTESIARDIYDCLILLGDGNIKNGLIKPKDIKTPYQNKFKNTQLGLFDDFFIKEDSARFNKYLSNNFKSHILLSHPKITQKQAIFLDKFYTLMEYDKLRLESLFKYILNSEFFTNIKTIIATDRLKYKYKTIVSNQLNEAIEIIDKKISILHQMSKSYDDLPRFLNSITLNSAESSSGEGVNLLTIHASKGLEFEDVYIIDLMDGRFPNIKLISKSGSLEEERRLFYVATTRAKTNIYFSFAHYDNNKNISYAPSIFLKEANLLNN